MSFFFSPQALFGGYPQHAVSVATPFAHPFVQHVAPPSPFGLFAQPVQHLRHLERGRRHGRAKQAQCDLSPCFSQQPHEVEGQFQVVQHFPDGSIVIRPYPSHADDVRTQQRLELERQQRQKEAEQAAAIAHAKVVCEERCKFRQREYERFIRELQLEEERKQQQQHPEEAKKQSVEDKPHEHEPSPRELQKAQAQELLQQLFGSFFDIQFEDDEEQTPAVEQAKSTTDVTTDEQATTPVVLPRQHVDSEDEGELFVDPFASLFGFPFTRPRRRHPQAKRAQRCERTPKEEQPEQKQAEQPSQQQESIETTTTPSPVPPQSQSSLQEDKAQATATTTTTTTTTTVGDVEDETPVSDQDDHDNTNDAAYDPYDITAPLIVDVEVQPAQLETKAEHNEPAPTTKEAPATQEPSTTPPAVQTSSQQLLARLLAQNEKLFTKRSALFNKIKLLQNQSTPLSTQDHTQLATLQQHLEHVDALIAQSQTHTDQLLAELY